MEVYQVNVYRLSVALLVGAAFLPRQSGLKAAPTTATCPPLPEMLAYKMYAIGGDGRRVPAHKLNAVSGVGRRAETSCATATPGPDLDYRLSRLI